MHDIDAVRLASRRLLDRAFAATPGPWQMAQSWAGSNAIVDGEGHPVAVCGDDYPAGGYFQASADRRYVATMQPVVAIALANLLTAVAQAMQGASSGDVAFERFAVRIARVVLGTEAD